MMARSFYGVSKHYMMNIYYKTNDATSRNFSVYRVHGHQYMAIKFGFDADLSLSVSCNVFDVDTRFFDDLMPISENEYNSLIGVYDIHVKTILAKANMVPVVDNRFKMSNPFWRMRQIAKNKATQANLAI